jgi:hypothetical protein
MALPLQLSLDPALAGTVFSQYFTIASLQTAFFDRFAQSRSKGIDRLNGRQYGQRIAADLNIVSSKCNSGKFRFSPYLENLKPRGRARAPRLISIPTIRDRIVLHQLNKYLAAMFPECVTRNIASVYVREIAANLASVAPSTTFVCGCDIKSFYDSIQRDRLLAILQRKIPHLPALSLIAHAIGTPTVPKSAPRPTHRDHIPARGIPQGLAISNILAAIALQEVDRAMLKMPIAYYRYVDDILMYGQEADVRKSRASLAARLRRRGLALHPIGSGKSQIGPLQKPFGYLGYQFVWPRVTVRESTVERLLQSLAAKFSDYMHNTEDRLRLVPGITKDQMRMAFVLELNEKITGSVSRNRKYGWIAYFNEITDLELLHKLDRATSKMFKRLSDFQHTAPSNLKRFARAYFEMKFNASGHYVQNYDRIVHIAQMRAFLVERGRLPIGENISDEAIALQYDSYRRYILRTMQADEGATYG